MRKLFDLDMKDYDEHGSRFSRASVRGIFIRGGRIAMICSTRYGYYKLPGGGQEAGESRLKTLIREIREETGLRVTADSVREYGYVHRVQKGATEDIFEQYNYYYLCQAEAEAGPPNLDEYEAEEGFMLEFVLPEQAVAANRLADHGPKDPVMIEREARVLELLVKEKHFEAE